MCTLWRGHSREDAAELTLGDARSRIGWRGDEPVGASKMKAFFELDIEQGRSLKMNRSRGGQHIGEEIGPGLGIGQVGGFIR